MGFRDELEAARARIQALERERARLEREKVTLPGTPAFAVVSAVSLVAIVALGIGLAFEWHRADEAEEKARTWRQIEGETAAELEDMRHRLVQAQQHEVGPDDTSLRRIR